MTKRSHQCERTKCRGVSGRKFEALEGTREPNRIHSELRQIIFHSIMAEQQQQQQQQLQQANESTTLRQVLTQERPLVLSTLRVKAPTPSRRDIPWSKIRLWHQFSLENINTFGARILDQPLTGLNEAIPMPSTCWTICVWITDKTCSP